MARIHLIEFELADETGERQSSADEGGIITYPRSQPKKGLKIEVINLPIMHDAHDATAAAV
jgi:hypothetical protein